MLVIKNNQAHNRTREARKIGGGIINDNHSWGMLVYTYSQLLVNTDREYSSQSGYIGKVAKYYQKSFGMGLVDNGITRTELKYFLPDIEYDILINKLNKDTQIINKQSRCLAA